MKILVISSFTLSIQAYVTALLEFMTAQLNKQKSNKQPNKTQWFEIPDHCTTYVTEFWKSPLYGYILLIKYSTLKSSLKFWFCSFMPPIQ